MAGGKRWKGEREQIQVQDPEEIPLSDAATMISSSFDTIVILLHHPWGQTGNIFQHFSDSGSGNVSKRLKGCCDSGRGNVSKRYLRVAVTVGGGMSLKGT